VIEILARRVTEPRKFAIRKRSGAGCSRIPRKAAQWMRDLADRGCDHIVIVNDLDRNQATNELNDHEALSKTLHGIQVPPLVKRLVCIPVEEIEAWFWADDKVVKHVGRGKGSAHPSPHKLARPKETLAKLSRDAGRKPRYSTNDNPELAKMLNIDVCASRCSAFGDLVGFFGAIC
jgi:hypothetical protein